MSDKRKVSTDALETLGTIFTEGQRDAIHLAVEPVIAGEKIMPGQDIGIGKDGKAYSKAIMCKYLGIADPFLKEQIQVGEKFWLIVYPRQITSLRHVWSHPDFKESEVTIKETSSDEMWLREFAEKIGISYSRLMDGAKEYIETGDYLYMGDNETYSDYYHEMEEFWDRYKVVTGESPSYKGGFFTCSC